MAARSAKKAPATKDDSTVFEVAGKSVDVAPHLPLNLGDWRKVKARYGFDVIKGMNADNLDIDSIIGILTVALEKADPDITEADVETLDASAFGKLTKIITAGSSDASDPI